MRRSPAPDASPTEAEFAQADEVNAKAMHQLRSQLGEANAWLWKLREALGVKTNAQALAVAKGLRKLVTGP